MHTLFAFLTFSVWVWGYALYIAAVLRRQTTPRFGYWLTIVAVDVVLLVSQLRSGVTGNDLLQTTIWVVGASLTLLVTLWQQRQELALNRYEWICLLLSFLSAILSTIVPVGSVVIQTLGMVIGSIPLWINVGHGHERWQPFGICLAASFLNLGALNVWNVENLPGLLPHLVAVVLNLVTTTTAVLGRQAAFCRRPDIC